VRRECGLDCGTEMQHAELGNGNSAARGSTRIEKR
jgi:hypothetical protein